MRATEKTVSNSHAVVVSHTARARARCQTVDTHTKAQLAAAGWLSPPVKSRVINGQGGA